jgi:hypothetical protein
MFGSSLVSVTKIAFGRIVYRHAAVTSCPSSSSLAIRSESSSRDRRHSAMNSSIPSSVEKESVM